MWNRESLKRIHQPGVTVLAMQVVLYDPMHCYVPWYLSTNRCKSVSRELISGCTVTALDKSP